MNRAIKSFFAGVGISALFLGAVGVVGAAVSQFGLPGYFTSTPSTLSNNSGAAIAIDANRRVEISSTTPLVVSSAGTASNPIATGYFTDLTADTATFNTTTIVAIATTTKLGIGDGTVSAPSLFMTDDTDTGLYSSANGTLDVTTDGTNRLSIGNTGLITQNSTVAIASMATGFLSDNGQFTTAVWNRRKIGVPNGSVLSVVAGTGVTVGNFREHMLIQGSGGAVTITATPSIAVGQNGEKICFVGYSDPNTVTFQDESVLANSSLQLAGGVDATLGLGDTLCLIYITAQADWFEVSRSNN
jgi:hypothetical protein